MKYYKKKIWKDMNSKNEHIRKNAEKKWYLNSQKYFRILEKIKCKIPEDLITAMEGSGYFHDYIIRSMNFLQDGTMNKKTFSILVENGDDAYRIEMYGVSKVKMALDGLGHGTFDRLEWGYCEMKIVNKEIKMSILCNISCEISIAFKRVSVKHDKPTPA